MSDEVLQSALPAGVRIDSWRHALVAGGVDHSSGKFNCADSDAAERSCRHALWNSVPGAGARVIRSAWSERSGDFAGTGGLWVVWDSGVDRRTGDFFDAENFGGGGRTCSGQGLAVLFSFLGA